MFFLISSIFWRFSLSNHNKINKIMCETEMMKPTLRWSHWRAEFSSAWRLCSSRIHQRLQKGINYKLEVLVRRTGNGLTKQQQSMGGPVHLLVLLYLLLDPLVGLLSAFVFLGIIFRTWATKTAHYICQKTWSPIRFWIRFQLGDSDTSKGTQIYCR